MHELIFIIVTWLTAGPLTILAMGLFYEPIYFALLAHRIQTGMIPYFTAHSLDDYAEQAQTAFTFLILLTAVRIVLLLFLAWTVILVLDDREISIGYGWYYLFALVVCLSTVLSSIIARWLWRWSTYFGENGEAQFADMCGWYSGFLIFALCMLGTPLVTLLSLSTWMKGSSCIAACVAGFKAWRTARAGYQPIPAEGNTGGNNDQSDDDDDDDNDCDDATLRSTPSSKSLGKRQETPILGPL